MTRAASDATDAATTATTNKAATGVAATSVAATPKPVVGRELFRFKPEVVNVPF